MREATKNLEESSSRGLAKLHIEIVIKWEVLQSATQAYLEQEISLLHVCPPESWKGGSSG